MGHRHLGGLAELQRLGLAAFELVAACDPVDENARSLAARAGDLLGHTPALAATLEDVAGQGAAAVAITSLPSAHHSLAVEALERGWHVLVEKPLGLTVAACAAIQEAADASTSRLSVAENYRRDPLCRLAKALLDAGVVGAPRLLVQHSVGGGDRMAINMWRHLRQEGGLLLDVGVHYTDVLEYLLGEIDSVFAATCLHEPVRRTAGASDPSGAYGQWQRELPPEFAATAEDALYATLTFRSGVIGQFIIDHAGHGQPQWQRSVHGSTGSLSLPSDRSGGAIALHLDGGETLEGGALLELVPEFALDATTAALFGGDRLTGYDYPFEETDPKLLAVEYDELGRAIEHGGPLETQSAEGMRAVACCFAMLESGAAGMPVRVADVLDGTIAGYQRKIDRAAADAAARRPPR